MKKLLWTTMILMVGLLAYGQNDEDYSRDGKFFIETGYSVFANTGYSNGSGFSHYNTDGGSITSIGFEAGKFVSQDLAFKLKMGLISSGGELLSLLGGIKYYIAGVAPLDLGVGFLDSFGTIFAYSATIGYAATLANNIYLEPSLGIAGFEESTALNIKLNFVLLF